MRAASQRHLAAAPHAGGAPGRQRICQYRRARGRRPVFAGCISHRARLRRPGPIRLCAGNARHRILTAHHTGEPSKTFCSVVALLGSGEAAVAGKITAQYHQKPVFCRRCFRRVFLFLSCAHPLAVSFATQKWAKTDIPELLAHWQKAHEIMVKDRAHLKRSMLLRYEDWVAQPARTSETIACFLGIDSLTPSADLESSFNNRYFTQWEKYKNKAACAPFENFARTFGYCFDASYVGETR